MPFVQKRVQMHCERLKMSRWVVIVNATYPKVKYEKFQKAMAACIMLLSR
jgi:hypothetical protein